ncbi:TPA: Fic family protein [Candidatus Woesearchaeota archaeon]|nr:Fic family protein [Candidatus Woesearchaeota archaeon]HIH39453.1 Fic family protein [Candidatus Woesearchaeota archaeon]
MFIEKQKAGKHTKYYLAHSFRDGAEVVKVRRYLGKDINENELGQRREKAEKAILEQIKNFREIRDPLRFNLSNEEIEGIKKLSHKKDFKIFHLNEKQWTRFSELFSYNTNAIEGSTLTLRDVTNVLEHHKEPDKSKPDIEEAKGVSEAISFIRNTKEHISIELIKKLHSIVFKNSKHFAGKLREKGIEVVIRDGVGNIVHRGAPSEKITVLLGELIKWYESNKAKYPPILLAAVVHNQFENIHPFQDGNGRVGRLLLNNILLKHKLPPVDIEFKNRAEYYQSLQEYENNGNIRLTIELILKEYRKLRKKL